MRCIECDGTYRKQDYDYYMYGTYLCKVKAFVCDKCGQALFNETASKKIDTAAKKKGLWGIAWKTKIGKVGNSLDVKIKKQLADYMNIRKGDEVRMFPEGKKRLIIEIG